jgi:hypothetical protein
LNDENARLANEISQFSVEAAQYTRISAENIRLNNENTRLSAATGRMRLEVAQLTRVLAENSRLNDENTRLAAETSRLEKEVSRLQGGYPRGRKTTTEAIPPQDDQVWIGRIRQTDIDRLSVSKKQELDDGIRLILQLEFDASSASAEKFRLLSDTLFKSAGIPIDYFWRGKGVEVVTATGSVPLKLEYLAIWCGYGLTSSNTPGWYDQSIAIYTMILVGRYRGVIVD